MRYFYAAALLSVLVVSCKSRPPAIVDQIYIDSLISHFAPTADVKHNEADMNFWKSRIDPKQPRQVNESKYASTLIGRFHQFGDIADIKKSRFYFQKYK